jgi:MoxR-like ATPase
MAPQPAAGTTTTGAFSAVFEDVVSNVSRVIHGKEAPTRLALICLLSEGHLLLEDVPGVGKTTLAKALARSFDLVCRRVQFTPDLLPSDVTGTTIYDRASGRFEFRPGPVFANVLIGDEINRASPKTQSALLEAMQEHQVTVDNTSHKLPSPFIVLATQNPTEHEGTYPLPESQLDRFFLRVRMGYPDRGAEISMLDWQGGEMEPEDLSPVADAEAVPAMVGLVNRIHLASVLKGYLVDLAAATRGHPALHLGMSPRSTLALQRASRAFAASEGREYVIPDDIKAMFVPVVEHRLTLSSDATVSGVDILDVLSDILRVVPVPSGHPAAG